VPIRTAWIDNRARRVEYGTGSGVTWESSAHAEYDETRAKAGVLTDAWPPFRLIETMRADNGVVQRLDRHVRRAADSAAYFDFAFDVSRARRIQADAARALHHQTGPSHTNARRRRRAAHQGHHAGADTVTTRRR
jgi:para-aminobenzoate synthetase/4-amino-4-deoxychorismate lyase